jgi:hypothetical protein
MLGLLNSNVVNKTDRGSAVFKFHSCRSPLPGFDGTNHSSFLNSQQPDRWIAERASSRVPVELCSPKRRFMNLLALDRKPSSQTQELNQGSHPGQKKNLKATSLKAG